LNGGQYLGRVSYRLPCSSNKFGFSGVVYLFGPYIGIEYGNNLRNNFAIGGYHQTVFKFGFLVKNWPRNGAFWKNLISLVA
jgi:hypothetical protein